MVSPSVVTEAELKKLVVTNVCQVLLGRGAQASMNLLGSLYVSGMNVSYFIDMHQKDRRAERNPGQWYAIVKYSSLRTSGSQNQHFVKYFSLRKDGTFDYAKIADALMKVVADELQQVAYRNKRQKDIQVASSNEKQIQEFLKEYKDLPSNVLLEPTTQESAPIHLSLHFQAITLFQAHAILAVLKESGLITKKDEVS